MVRKVLRKIIENDPEVTHSYLSGVALAKVASLWCCECGDRSIQSVPVKRSPGLRSLNIRIALPLHIFG